MNNLYYIEYVLKIDDINPAVYGEVYAVDTGFGVLELGCVENGQIYEDTHLRTDCKTFKQYINNFTGTVLSFTRV